MTTTETADARARIYALLMPLAERQDSIGDDVAEAIVILASLPPAPDGEWRWVPVEATPEMQHAIYQAIFGFPNGAYPRRAGETDEQRIYRAMLQAAPTTIPAASAGPRASELRLRETLEQAASDLHVVTLHGDVVGMHREAMAAKKRIRAALADAGEGAIDQGRGSDA